MTEPIPPRPPVTLPAPPQLTPATSWVPLRKITTGTIMAAVVTVVVTLAMAFGVEPPASAAAAATGLLAMLAAYLVSEPTTTPRHGSRREEKSVWAGWDDR